MGGGGGGGGGDSHLLSQALLSPDQCTIYIHDIVCVWIYNLAACIIHVHVHVYKFKTADMYTCEYLRNSLFKDECHVENMCNWVQISSIYMYTLISS